jgi:hypothetical protein
MFPINMDVGKIILIMLFTLLCSGAVINCTVWEHFAQQFHEFVQSQEQNPNEKGNIVILTLARIKDPAG